MLTDIHESIAAIKKPGAEKLVGKGAMIVYLPNDGLIYKHIQGAYMPESGIKKLLGEIEFNIPNRYKLSGTVQSQSEGNSTEAALELTASVDVYDKKLAEAIIWVLSRDTAANSGIKSLGVGHGKAKDIMNKLVQLDLITPQDIEKPLLRRQVKSKSLDELLQTPELMDILARNGFSETDIAEAINKRLENTALSLNSR